MRPASKRSNHSGPSVPKRTRFASPSEQAGGSSSRAKASSPESTAEQDDLLEADLPEGAARAKNRSKRQIKDKDGYGSDSSNDEESVVASRRPGVKEDADEDVDMFADDVDEKKDDGKSKGKGKEKEFLDMDDIEGQEFDRRRGGTTDDSDSDSEGVTGKIDERIERKKAKEKDLGFEVTPFNMKAEMDEGRFTADGEAYIENDKDPNDKHDVWLVDYDKDEIRKARKAHKEREKQEAERERLEDEGIARDKQIEFMKTAIELMERGETVLEALQRIGAEVEEKRKKEEQAQGKKKLSWAERQKERKAAMAQEEAEKDSIHTSNPFTNLSNIVSALTATSQIDVYSLSRESMQRMLPDQGSTSNGSSVQRPTTPQTTDTRKFQYRFSMAYIRKLPEGQRPVEREIFGPFPVQQLQQWRGTGFFGGPACENVELRKAGDESLPWGPWSDVVG